MEVINPQVQELERRVHGVELTVAKMEGEMQEVKRIAGDTTRQTIWQFVIFTLTMLLALIGAIKYQTDVMRREMDLRFEVMEKRFQAVEQRIELSEKNLTARFEDLKQEVRANRK